LGPLLSLYSWTCARTSTGSPVDSRRRACKSTSTSKWPLLQTMAPSFIFRKCSRRMMPELPVTVMKMSPTAAASPIGITMKPSIAASRARIGSTSVTTTLLPRPRARARLRVDVVEPAQRHEDQGRHQVGAVVHRHLRLVLQGGDDVLVIGVVVLAADRVDGDAVVLHEAGGDVVLGGQRVGGDQHE